MFDTKTILFAAGGTAGHINPALSVAGLVRYLHPGCGIHFVGTADRMEARLVPEAGYAFHTIDISGFQRDFSPAGIRRNLATLRKLAKVTGQVNRLLNEIKPGLVIGFGGYVSGPVLRAAAKAGIPTAIHEANAFPGMANKALAPRVDAVMLADIAAAARMRCKNEPVVTGLPIRREFSQCARARCRAELSLDTRPLVLSMGGSQGARALNEAVCGMIAQLWPARGAYFCHAYGQGGRGLPEDLRARGVDTEAPEIDLREYVSDTARCMAAADLFIGRAGASTICELQALGKPAVLVPYPYAAENHQYYNAKTLADRGAAIVIEEKDLTAQLLAKTVKELLNDPARLQAMGETSKAMAVTDANERIYSVLCTLVGG
ncbi:MAG: undecaprenyldiphospho-muramoylpentapeptide beta-N-acetylglucosaminyltransferase [Oscillospiraceae bacterium]|jgi:UDP-N-acetylglucosamine--N-acetylmuramyl-(pentapeptide) pyrophosphoryl-undecaprenol N-acetylglucosamine transferase|nr:undecaprenyldiphospho-muramoylpentapeptide beta-N-acetylglucosaminyltransferase [Oscillospiraceae bacterium]